jgi:citrate synthase
MTTATETTEKVAKGLEGIVVATTKLSKVDGIAGRLYYRGYSIDDLAENGTFEEIAYLLWYGHLPNKRELAGSNHHMVEHRDTLRRELVAQMSRAPEHAVPMAVLRCAVSFLGHYDPDADNHNPEVVLQKAYLLTSQFATAIAAYDRIRKGLKPVEPRLDLSHAAHFLYMLTGEEPSPIAARALDTYLILLADHGFNASTFAARVTASTLTDLYSAITSAVGTLKGPLHGAANEGAMEQFVEIGDTENVKAWFEQAKAEKRRIMGIGHRVYKVFDPRGRLLRRMAIELNQVAAEKRWLDIALKLEQVAAADPYFNERRLYPNVDYYSAPVLYTLGIAVDLFPCIFAMARVVGWTAHVMEQWEDNRLIRPTEEYIGPLDLPWVALEKRG